MKRSTSLIGDVQRRWFLAAIILSAVASFVHVLATPEHFEEWFGYGLFFLVMAGLQDLFAFLLLYAGPAHRKLLWAGIVGNALIIGLYLVTRTVGIPFFGPEAGEVEAVGGLDVFSKLVEVALIVCLVQLLRTASEARTIEA